MKLKKILSGFLAAAMAVTSMVTATFNASAAEAPYIKVIGNTQYYALSLGTGTEKELITDGTNTYTLSYTNSAGYGDTFDYETDKDYEGLFIRFYDDTKGIESAKLLSVSVDGEKKDVGDAPAVAKAGLYDPELSANGAEKGYEITFTPDQRAAIGAVSDGSTITFEVEVTYDGSTPVGGANWTKRAAGAYKYISIAKPDDVTDYGSGDICPAEEVVDLSDLLPTGKMPADIRKIKITASVGLYESAKGAIGTNIITADQPTEGEWADASWAAEGTDTTTIAELETPLGVAVSTLQLQSHYMNYGTTVNVKIEVEVAEVVPHTITISPAIENGTVKSDKTTAAKGDTVTLTVNPATGYELDTLTVATSTASTVTVAADNTFEMPDADVTVTATFKEKVVPLESISLDKTESVLVGGTTKLTATKVPENTTVKTDITWTSSDETVAAVASDGTVSGLKAGTATITAACGEIKATCEVTVTAEAKPCTDVTLDKTTAEVKKGETVTLKATKTPTDTTDKITWITSDASVATVADGVVIGVARGTATITVKCGEKTATCEVSVTEDKTVASPVAAGGQKSYEVVSTVNGKEVKTVDTVYAITEADLACKGYQVTITNPTNGKTITREIKNAYKSVTVKSAEDLGNDTFTGYYLVVRVTNVPKDVNLSYAFNKIS